MKDGNGDLRMEDVRGERGGGEPGDREAVGQREGIRESGECGGQVTEGASKTGMAGREGQRDKGMGQMGTEKQR